MCRNIKQLYNFEPPATQDEVREAALQFVRKISGSTKPSQANEAVFNDAVEHISKDLDILLAGLHTHAHSHDRETEAAKHKARIARTYGVA